MIEELKKIVAEEKDEIRQQYKAQIKAVFGSYARGDFHADSDLDLLVDFDESVTLFDMIGLEQFLEDKLGCPVDVVSQDTLREELRASVFNEMIHFDSNTGDFTEYQLRRCVKYNDLPMRNYRLYIQDIFEAMEAVQAFIAEIDFETFVADDKTASAVVRKLEIIGEATKNVPEEIRQKYSQVPWKQMAGMRDRIIHAYFDVNHAIIWEVVTELIPPLQPIIKQILKDTEEEQVHER